MVLWKKQNITILNKNNKMIQYIMLNKLFIKIIFIANQINLSIKIKITLFGIYNYKDKIMKIKILNLMYQ